MRFPILLAGFLLLAAPALAADTMPANIQAIMKKMSQGQMPSAADQKAIADWSASMSGGSQKLGTTSTALNHESNVEEDEQGAQNLCKTGGRAGFGAAPSQDAYVAMAKQAFDTYGARMPDGGLLLLKGQLDRATNPTWGADVSLLLMARTSGSAAVVAAASSARRAPRDALTANNLGVALRGMKDYVNAAIAFGYAKSLAPDSTVIATNMGWLAISRHDAKTAGQLFNAALSKNKVMSAALSGNGLIAQCSGEHAQAVKFFRASLQNGYSRLADVGLQSAINDIRQTNPGADIGSPADDGPSGKSVPTPQWPDPPIAGSAKEMAQWQLAVENSKVRKWRLGWEDALTAQGDIINQIGIKADAGASADVSDRKITYRRGFAREMERVADLKRMLYPQLQQASDLIGVDVKAYQVADGCRTCTGNPDVVLAPCSTSRSRVIGLYPIYAGKFHSDWAMLGIATGKYYQAVGGAIADITDSNLRQQEQAVLMEEVIGGFGLFASNMETVEAETESAYDPSDRDCGQVPALAIKPGTLKPYPLDPNACKSGETHMNFGLVNFNADCEKMTLDFGEALVGSGEYKFGNDWGSDQLTIFAGVGVSGGLGPLSAGAKTGAYMTFQGGQVMDYGNSSSASVSIGSGPISAGSEASARISAVSGVDVALDSGVHVGGVSPE